MAAARRGRVDFAELADETSLGVLAHPATVPIDKLAHHPRNPRYGYTDTGELAKSLQEVGQKQAVGVVPVDVYLSHYPDDAELIGAAEYVVIMGNRRLAAARQAGLASMKITVEDALAGAEAVPESALIENIHREALPPLLEAQELRALVKKHGSQSKVAKRISKSQGWISQRLALLKLSPELQEQLKAGELTVEDARAVAGKEPEDQPAALELIRTAKGASSGNDDGGEARESVRSETRRNRSSKAGERQRTVRLTDPVEDIAASLRATLSTRDCEALARLLLTK